MNSSAPPETGLPMYFSLLGRSAVKDAASRSGPRLGCLSLNKVSLETPSFIAPASRGAVPHLSHDNLRDHTDIKGIYVALEDFVEKFPPNVPIYNHTGTLRTFTSTPPNALLILAGRRVPPVTTAASNTDHSLAILTSVGFRMLKVDDYINGVKHLRPDIVLGLPDLPQNMPGKSRTPKMVFRTELWLQELINKNAAWGAEERTRIFAPLLPLEWEQQSYYIEFLKSRVDSLSGLALYDSSLAVEIPEELEGLPRMSLDDPGNPHKVLQQVDWGIDLFNLAFITQLTDAGIALDFQFPKGEAEDEGEAGKDRKKPLAVDLWGTEYAADLSPLRKACGCYVCRRHHRAYVQHLLVTKEMTAWVLLQIHNTRTIEAFFAAIRASISRDTFEEDRALFAKIYEAELPERTGQGPRLRGYQFKSQGGTGKKNPKGFTKLGAAGGLAAGGDRREALEEAATPGEMLDKGLVEGGFAERLS